MKPTLGRIVLYLLTEDDAGAINRRRTTGGRISDLADVERWPEGAQAHIGNTSHAGQAVPMVIVQVWPNEYGEHDGVNGQCLLDGNDVLWVTSRKEGTEPGTWSWPPRSP